MFFGYADESGEPGVAKSDHDYFVFCIILFKNREAALKASNLVDEFRRENHFSETHEFHYATDSKKTRASFSKFIKKLDFIFVFVAIKKDSYMKTSSFNRMARLTKILLQTNNISVDVIMDTNPRLASELRKLEKTTSFSSHFSERKSRGNNLVQVADYVTALTTRAAKYPDRRGAAELYAGIAKKCIAKIEK